MLALLKEVWLKAKKALTTLSGVLIHFTLQKPQKAKKLVLTYLPQQDLNGYSKPWLGGNGRNILEYKGTPSAASGITASITTDSNGNKHYTLNGTKTVGASNVFFNLNYTSSSDVNIPTGNWIISCDNANIYLRVYQDGTKVAETSPGGSASFSITAGATYSYCRVQIPNDSTHNFSDEEINVMIRDANDPDTTYEPYSNICTISGRSNDRIAVTGKNLLRTSLASIKTNNTAGTWSGDTYSYQGIDWTPITDDQGRIIRIHSQGTALADSRFRVGDYDARIGQAFIMTGCPASGGGTKWRQYISTTGANGNDNGNGVTITPTADVSAASYIRVYSGNTVNFDWYPMLRPATDTDPTFEPADIIEIDPSFGTTLYGGSYDIVSGQLADYYEVIDLGTKTWTRGTTGQTGHYRYYTVLNGAQEPVASTEENPNSVCTGFALVDTTWNCKIGYTIAAETGYLHIYSAVHDGLTPGNFKTAMSGVKVYYRKVTPVVTSLTAVPVDLHEGENNINARRATDMTLVYESEE